MDIHPNTIRDLKEVAAGRSPVGHLDAALASTVLALVEAVAGLQNPAPIQAPPMPNKEEAP